MGNSSQLNQSTTVSSSESAASRYILVVSSVRFSSESANLANRSLLLQNMHDETKLSGQVQILTLSLLYDIPSQR